AVKPLLTWPGFALFTPLQLFDQSTKAVRDRFVDDVLIIVLQLLSDACPRLLIERSVRAPGTTCCVFSVGSSISIHEQHPFPSLAGPAQSPAYPVRGKGPRTTGVPFRQARSHAKCLKRNHLLAWINSDEGSIHARRPRRQWHRANASCTSRRGDSPAEWPYPSG